MQFQALLQLVGLTSILPFARCQQPLSVSDRLTIIDQLNLHQTYIDNDASYASAVQWLSLYWPEATFTAIDAFGTVSKTGSDPSNNDGMKYLYDFDHSVFPIGDWFHTVGVYQFIDIDTTTLTPVYGPNNQTRLHWRWRVDWKVNTTGVVSTGLYDDVFENKNGVWKCLNRTSTIDANWPAWLFRPYAETADARFKSSAPSNASTPS